MRRSKRQQERLKQRREKKAKRKAEYATRAAMEKKRTDAKRSLINPHHHPIGPCGNVGCSWPQCRWSGEGKRIPIGLGAMTPREIQMAHRGYKMPRGPEAEAIRARRAAERRQKRRMAA